MKIKEIEKRNFDYTIIPNKEIQIDNQTVELYDYLEALYFISKYHTQVKFFNCFNEDNIETDSFNYLNPLNKCFDLCLIIEYNKNELKEVLFKKKYL